MSIDYRTATAIELAAALRARKVGAAELAEIAIAEIEARDGPINAVVVRDFDRARKAAERADRALAEGREGALLGVPMTVKESWDIAGLPTTWGVAEWAGSIATEDAVAIQRLKAAGAVILGKTNVPPFLADWQSANPVYGRTSNPLDLSRSPGGSSGGSAAALAAGFTPLELGSDIGGSIRVPAVFCGVYGHKPSYGIVPLAGHLPPGFDGQPPRLSVGGPLARSPADLDLALSIVAGTHGDAAKGYRLELPPPRHARLSGWRILILDSHPRCAVTGALRQALSGLGSRLEASGAKVVRAQPNLPDLSRLHRDYVKMLTTILSRREGGGREAIDAHQWLDLVDAQHRARRRFAALFEEIDAIVAPAFGTAAFPHDDEPQWRKRTLVVDGEETPFGDQFVWAGLASFPNLPATALPIGKDETGLPLGAQIIGPFLEDRTTIALAGWIAGLTG